MFYEVPNKLIPQSEFTTITHLGDDYSSKRGTEYENYIYCSVCHPLTYYLHTCKANQHMGQLLSPGGIEKLLKLGNNIVIGRRSWINSLPFYDDTHTWFLFSITSFTRHIQTDHLLWGFAAIVGSSGNVCTHIPYVNEQFVMLRNEIIFDRSCHS